MRILISILLFLSLHLLQAQTDYTWWNNIHNWDGVRPWESYISEVPGIMGPNALPVPEMQHGILDTQIYILAAGEVHYKSNDFTANAFTKINVPIKNAVAIQVWWVPVEYFKTDTVVRDQRAARTRSAEGFASGDVYIGTLIPIFQNHEKWPDLLLGINLKTASGTRFHDSRYTDSPGYYFDLSGGKNFDLKSTDGWVIRPHAMAGFYVYQTHREDYYQNDAFLWGAGLDFSNKKWWFSAQATGYAGYLNYLDTPVVIRLEAHRIFEKTRLVLRAQQGNDSYPFTSIRLGLQWRL